MPELPDVDVYVSALAARIVGMPVAGVTIASPFVLRTAVPPIDAIVGRRVTGVRRLGKRIVVDLEGDLHLVVHLMIDCRLRWHADVGKSPERMTLALIVL
jgi:formamidopyrimidine-DNA glycosylase